MCALLLSYNNNTTPPRCRCLVFLHPPAAQHNKVHQNTRIKSILMTRPRLARAEKEQRRNLHGD
jgi:hypothetical protein